LDNYYSGFHNRMFRSPDSEITGESVVIENNSEFEDSWPYSLSDYLRNFIGKRVQVKYEMSGGRHCEQEGALIVAGSNFLGLQPYRTNDLLLIELDSVKCVSISEFKKGAGTNRKP
jgi:hypothetical protein